MLRDRFVLSLLAATVLLAGVAGLYWPTSLDHYDRWGFRIHCGSGVLADYGQATIADQAETSAAGPVERPGDAYVDQCHSATWWRRAWAGPLVFGGVALSIALLLGFQRRTPATAKPDDD
jgi:hypothetical protein